MRSAATLFADRYQLLAELGEGTAGRVYRARDVSTGAEVALKVLAGTPDPLEVRRERRLMGRLHHPNCAAVLDGGTLADGTSYLVMELVDGPSLEALAPAAPECVAEWVAQLARALDALHQQGLVHKDVKPANARLGADGQVVLLDFGLLAPSGLSGQTPAGTPEAMAPEVIRRDAVDARADLYALGVLAYTLLVGEGPFAGRAPLETLAAHLDECPVPPSRRVAGVDEATDAWVLALLAKAPGARPPSARALLALLGATLPADADHPLLAPPLVGRSSELDELRRALATPGPGRAWHWQGAPGVGKTRLLAEGVAIARDHDIPAACGRAGSAPYAHFREVLATLLPAMRTRVPGSLALHAPVLAQLLPWLEAAPVLALETPRAEMLRLQGAVTGVLGALAAAGGCVVALDDWQHADELSRDLYAACRRRLAAVPILWLMASTTDTGEEGHPLPRLALPDVAAMLAGMLGTPHVNTEWVDAIHSITGGVPAHVARLVEHLAREGSLRQVDGQWSTEMTLRVDMLPRDLRTLAERDLGRLDEDGRSILELAALAPEEFELGLVAAVTRLEEPRLFDAWQALVRRGLLVPAPGSDGRRMQLTSRVVRELVLESVSPARRVTLHAAVARLTLAASDASMPGGTRLEVGAAARLARHALAGELFDEVAALALDAGRRLAALFASAPAAELLSAGLAHAGDPATRLALLEALGDVERYAQQIDEAATHYMEALPLADGARRGWLLASLAKVRQYRNDYAAAEALCDEAIATYNDAPHPDGEARARLTRARIRFFRGSAAPAHADAVRALALARAGAGPTRQAEALAFLGYLAVASVPARLAEGREALAEAIALAEQSGDVLALLNALDLLGNVQAIAGDHAAAVETFTRIQRLSEDTGNQAEAALSALNAAASCLELGQASRALMLAEVPLPEGNRGLLEGLALAYRLLATLRLGRYGETGACLAAADAMLNGSQDAYRAAQMLPCLLEARLVLGDLNAARIDLEALDAAVAATDDGVGRARARALGARLAGLTGRSDAEALAREALAAAEAAGSDGERARALCALARYLPVDEAGILAAEGLAIAEGLGLSTVVLDLLDLQGEFALRGGDHRVAVRTYARMAALARTCEAPLALATALFGQAAAAGDNNSGWLREARDLLVRLGERVRDASAFFRYPERQRILAGSLTNVPSDDDAW